MKLSVLRSIHECLIIRILIIIIIIKHSIFPKYSHSIERLKFSLISCFISLQSLSLKVKLNDKKILILTKINN